ncbi:MAG TPA: threonylcarbamoyl-AMP synthase [Candidatus Desulfofervidus auxilii]|uniref:L-threonylcarbamoyladenylate synthase n=1 Tax=Desulfofervidus auxilii TaxID=1621989 RepID=A0A7C0YBB0_DESA2|nr:threonylcarbamoyl-AMP synthase [Candidatus Desulfofervidus auxilii]
MAMILSSFEIEKAVRIIKEGKVIVYPTETFYGLGANALDKKAINKVFYIKKRPINKPISILIPDITWLERLVEEISPYAKELIRHFWPGPLTLVFKAKETVPSNLIASTGKIAIRISSHPLTQKFVKKLNLPITTTSANLSNNPPPTSIEEIDQEIKNKIDAIIDGGKTKGGLASTIIDVTTENLCCLRKGAIRLEDILKITGLKIY